MCVAPSTCTLHPDPPWPYTRSMPAPTAPAPIPTSPTQVVHRDVKPANVLVSGSGTALHTKLCDFGFARKCTSHNGVQQPTRRREHAQQAHGQLRGGADDQMSSYVVTRWYRAPGACVCVSWPAMLPLARNLHQLFTLISRCGLQYRHHAARWPTDC